MTLHRTIKWLTLFMLVLSIVITGAWGWARATAKYLGKWSYGHGSVITVYELNGHLYTNSEVFDNPKLNDATILGSFALSVDLGWMPFSSEEHETSWVNESVLIFDRPDLQVPGPAVLVQSGKVPMKDMLELAARSIDGTSPKRNWARSAVLRGPGERKRLYMPGVSNWTVNNAPRALALTGFLTLAGFTTLFIQRRQRRNRIRASHCPNCDYDLRGINTKTCPECGHTSPPPDILTD